MLKNTTDNKKTKIWKNINRVLKYILKNKPTFIISSIINILLLNLVPVVSLLITQQILNIIQNGTIELNKIFVLVSCYAGIDILQTILSAWTGYIITKSTLFLNLNIKNIILDKIQKITLSDYESSETYNTIQRAQNECEGKIPQFFNNVILIVGKILALLSYAAILLTFRWWMIFFIIFIPVIKYLFTVRLNKIQFKILWERTGEDRKAWYYNYILTNGTFSKELRLFNIHNYFQEKFNFF